MKEPTEEERRLELEDMRRQIIDILEVATKEEISPLGALIKIGQLMKDSETPTITWVRKRIRDGEDRARGRTR